MHGGKSLQTVEYQLPSPPVDGSSEVDMLRKVLLDNNMAHRVMMKKLRHMLWAQGIDLGLGGCFNTKSILRNQQVYQNTISVHTIP
jgi:hypothetical protein